jgi:hypothetical protein
MSGEKVIPKQAILDAANLRLANLQAGRTEAWLRLSASTFNLIGFSLARYIPPVGHLSSGRFCRTVGPGRRQGPKTEADNATERIFERPRFRPDQLSVLKFVTFFYAITYAYRRLLARKLISDRQTQSKTHTEWCSGTGYDSSRPERARSTRPARCGDRKT